MKLMNIKFIYPWLFQSINYLFKRQVIRLKVSPSIHKLFILSLMNILVKLIRLKWRRNCLLLKGRESKLEGKRKLRIKQIRDKNQTKNIPKNYGKAILSFIQKNVRKYHSIIKPILEKERLNLNDLLSHIKRHKREVNSINYLKQIWGYYDKCNPILKCIRILSYIFMRKHCLSYIFNSRVKNYFSHIKYRRRIIEGIEHPQEFTCIKQF